MPQIAQYLIKLSISLGVVYLFYVLILRRLTFYNWNRWYLLGYSMLSLLIPFINISPVLENHNWTSAYVVQMVPVMSNYTKEESATINGWGIGACILALGITVMLIRLIIQYFSFTQVKKSAELLLDDDVKVYQVNKNIVPFSFGKSIFINHEKYNETELKEIIRHEFIHVKQRHTIDVMWSELMCILNWYNPFAWLLRKGIRQNLEFIADHQVLQTGLDRRQYQYMLLKVVGGSAFTIGNQFNFSALKKRIAMMNKMKSARIHTIKFLFALPLLVVLLLAFRNVMNEQHIAGERTVIAGIIVDAVSGQPLSDVSVKAGSDQNTFTDARGYFQISSKPGESEALSVTKNGYLQMQVQDSKTGAINIIEYIGLVKEGSTGSESFLWSAAEAQTSNGLTYDRVAKIVSAGKTNLQVRTNAIKSGKIYYVVDGKSYILSGNGATASVDEITDVVYVNGEKRDGAYVNKFVDRNSIYKIEAIDGAAALKKYGVNKAVLAIYTKNDAPLVAQMTTDTIPGKEKIATIEVKNISRPPAADSAFILDASKSGPGNPYLLKRIKCVDFNISQQPLYIIDGEEREGVNLNELNPNDIDVITILKDESAIKLYGEKGRKGVIIIETKGYRSKGLGPIKGTLNPVAPTSGKVENHRVSVMVPNGVEPSLYVIDGKRFDSTNIIHLPHLETMNNIKSVEVLKGDLGTLRYGDAARNGVIIVSTTTSKE